MHFLGLLFNPKINCSKFKESQKKLGPNCTLNQTKKICCFCEFQTSQARLTCLGGASNWVSRGETEEKTVLSCKPSNATTKHSSAKILHYIFLLNETVQQRVNLKFW